MATVMASSTAFETGTAYKDPDVVLVDLTASAGNAPSNIATMMNTTASAVKSIFSAEQKKIATRTTVAEMETAATKTKAKSEGREATEEELEASCGPLAFLTDGFKILEEGLGDLWDGIGEFATDLGIAVNEFLGSAVDLANEVFDKISGIANDIAEAIAAGLTEVADALKASPLGQIYEAISEKVSELTDKISETISDLAAAASEAFDAALEKIEAFVDSLSLSNLFDTDCANEAKEEAMNTDQLSSSAEVESALSSNATRSVDPKASEAPAPFQERAEELPKAPEAGPSLQVAINRYREASIARDAAILEARNLIGGRGTSAQIASLKQRQTEANNRAMEAKRELEEAAGKDGRTLSSLPIWGVAYNQPKGVETADPAVVAAANASVEDLEKRYVAAVREFNRADDAQLKEKNKQIYNIFKPITAEDIARHKVLADEARVKAREVIAIMKEVLPGDRNRVFSKIEFTGPGLKN